MRYVVFRYSNLQNIFVSSLIYEFSNYLKGEKCRSFFEYLSFSHTFLTLNILRNINFIIGRVLFDLEVFPLVTVVKKQNVN